MTTRWGWQHAARSLAICTVIAFGGTASALAAEPIKVGLVAALSGPSAQSGEAITRGL